jgi:YD repeat-containing protein
MEATMKINPKQLSESLTILCSATGLGNKRSNVQVFHISDSIDLLVDGEDIQLNTRIKVKEHGELGFFAVNGSALRDVVVGMSGEKLIDMSLDGHGKLQLKAGKSRRGLGVEEYQKTQYQAPPFEGGFTVGAKDFETAVKNGSWCVNSSAAKLEFKGVSLKFTPGQLEVSSADNARAVRSVVNAEVDVPSSMLMPKKSAQVLHAIVKNAELPLTGRVYQGKLLFECGAWSGRIALFGSEMPNLDKMFHRPTIGEFTVDPALLKAAVQSLSTAAKYENTKIKFQTRGDILELSYTTLTSDGVDHIQIKQHGTPLEQNYVPRYLTQALDNAGQRTTIKYTDKGQLIFKTDKNESTQTASMI